MPVTRNLAIRPPFPPRRSTWSVGQREEFRSIILSSILIGPVSRQQPLRIRNIVSMESKFSHRSSSRLAALRNRRGESPDSFYLCSQPQGDRSLSNLVPATVSAASQDRPHVDVNGYRSTPISSALNILFPLSVSRSEKASHRPWRENSSVFEERSIPGAKIAA